MLTYQWKKVARFGPEINDCEKVLGNVIYRNKWYLVCMFSSNISGNCVTPRVICFDLKTYKWATVKVEGDDSKHPKLANRHASFWFYKNKLYLWARDNHRNDDSVSSEKSYIWALDFSCDTTGKVKLQWESYYLSGLVDSQLSEKNLQGFLLYVHHISEENLPPSWQLAISSYHPFHEGNVS